MAALRATQIYRGRVTSTSFVTVYTVPAGMRMILRSIVGHNAVGTGNQFFARSLTQQFLFILLAANGSAGDSLNWESWVVLNPGDTIQLAVSNATGVDVILSGSIHFV